MVRRARKQIGAVRRAAEAAQAAKKAPTTAPEEEVPQPDEGEEEVGTTDAQQESRPAPEEEDMPKPEQPEEPEPKLQGASLWAAHLTAQTAICTRHQRLCFSCGSCLPSLLIQSRVKLVWLTAVCAEEGKQVAAAEANFLQSLFHTRRLQADLDYRMDMVHFTLGLPSHRQEFKTVAAAACCGGPTGDSFLRLLLS